jgi:hypothetical protein
MNYILFDDSTRNNLLPLTFVRPTGDMRIGILTIREKWEKYLGTETSTITESYLAKNFLLSKPILISSLMVLFALLRIW